MAAPILQPYSSSMFNALPSLHDADAEFKERNAAATMKTGLANIFTKYNVEGFLGVQLLHRHFRLENEERLVDVGGASVPWSNKGSEALELRILPVSWAFEGDAYHAYEFKFVPPIQDIHSPIVPEPFLFEFNEALKAHDLQGVLGIRSLKPTFGSKPEMEITNGRSNITFDYDSGAAENDNAIEASWAFSSDGTLSTATFCTSYCSSRSDYGGHNKYHSTTSS
ncbi:hypothetical protein N431DRAFT_467278 [Stipitochalara longipes BDJ]|nr:hypothetical protein N431DRAFT_467278 [Stipitochalara longipes BDJ]